MYTIELPERYKSAFQPRTEAVNAPQPLRQEPEFQEEGAEIQNPIFNLIRLAFVFSLLAQNGSATRMAFLAVAAIVITLSQFGLLSWTAVTRFFGWEDNQEQAPAVEPVENESLWQSILTMSFNFIASLVPGLQNQPEEQQQL